MKTALLIVIALLIMCCMCMLCCFGSFLLMSNNQDFRTEYCAEWFKQGNTIQEEPFGWCK